jgi:tRNA(Arg) A34 adenosine deaminase TadA
MTENPLTERDLVLLRQAIAVSEQAKARGDHPFGALLADAGGAVLLTAENTVVTGRDVTGHAETNLVRAASARFTAADLADCSLYTSCEPCAMCAGAIYWSGIGRVVYALSELGLRAIASSQQGVPTMDLPCRTVFAGGRRLTTVIGPAIEDEAAAPHHGFWH